MVPLFRCQCPLSAEIPPGGRIVAQVGNGWKDCDPIPLPGTNPPVPINLWFACMEPITCAVYDAQGNLYSSMIEPNACQMILPTSAPTDIALPEPGASGLVAALALFGLLLRARRSLRPGPRRPRP